MKPDYHINDKADPPYLKITHKHSNYIAWLNPNESAFEDEFLIGITNTFSFRTPCLDPNKDVVVSARDFECYNPNIKDFHFNPDLKYLEVGPGIGGFVSHLIEIEKVKQNPIAIDPADYKLMIEIMFDVLEGLDLNPRLQDRILELISRCQLLLDPTRVKFYNMTLGQALEQYPNLNHSADVVVDHKGAQMYAPKTEKPDFNAEKNLVQLLKPNGVLIKNH